MKKENLRMKKCWIRLALVFNCVWRYVSLSGLCCWFESSWSGSRKCSRRRGMGRKDRRQ